jgi:hypothetical protein
VSVPFPRPVHVAGAAALTPFGADWRGLAARAAGAATPASLEVPALAPADDPCEPRHRKMMSRAAYLAAAAVRAALREPAVASLDVAPAEIGCFLGVGASGGEISELEAMLRESVAGGAFQLDRFGDAGLRAANPLFAFQLMNNFTLCHAAILAGLQGPNAAFFSRGAGTVRALREAAFAIAEGDAPAALAGGADSALYPVTAFELSRGDARARPSEAAAVLVLSARPTSVRLHRAEILRASPSPGASGAGLSPFGGEAKQDLPSAVAELYFPLAPRSGERIGVRGPALVVVSASDPDARAALADAAARADATEIIVVDRLFGETLAAAPAIAWTIALDWLGTRPAGSARVVSRGLDGELGVVELVKEAA